MQEGLFQTFKAPTRSKYQALQQLPDFLWTQMQRRNLNWERKNASQKSEWNEQVMLQTLAHTGCDELVSKCREFLTDMAYKMILQQLSIGTGGYEVERVAVEEARAQLNVIIHGRSRRAASATHFLCVFEREVSRRQDVVLLKVKARNGRDNAVDLVMVSDTGSFACTEPYFAQYAMPGRHILAAHASQYCNVNVLLHCHPRYHRKISNPPPGKLQREVAALTWSDKFSQTARTVQQRENYRLPDITRLTSWSWAIDQVSGRRVELILGGEQMAAAALHPPVHAIRDAPESHQSRKAKAINKLRRLSVEDVEQLAAASESNISKSSAKKQRTFTDPDTGTAIGQPSKPATRKAKRKLGAHESGAQKKRGKRF